MILRREVQACFLHLQLKLVMLGKHSLESWGYFTLEEAKLLQSYVTDKCSLFDLSYFEKVFLLCLIVQIENENVPRNHMPVNNVAQLSLLRKNKSKVTHMNKFKRKHFIGKPRKIETIT